MLGFLRLFLNPHFLQSVFCILVLIAGIVGWFLGKDISALIPFLGGIVGFTELKKLRNNQKDSGEGDG